MTAIEILSQQIPSHTFGRSNDPTLNQSALGASAGRTAEPGDTLSYDAADAAGDAAMDAFRAELSKRGLGLADASGCGFVVLHSTRPSSHPSYRVMETGTWAVEGPDGGYSGEGMSERLARESAAELGEGFTAVDTAD